MATDKNSSGFVLFFVCLWGGFGGGCQCVCFDHLKHLISHCDRKYQKQVFQITALILNFLLYLMYMVQVLIDWLVNISVYLEFYEGMSSVSIVTGAISTFWSMGLKTIFRIS